MTTFVTNREKHSFREKRNYKELRTHNVNKFKQINDIYVETRLTVSGLELQLDRIKSKYNANNKYVIIRVPSLRGKKSNITRTPSRICGIIESRINYKEFVQSLVFAISITESYISDTICLVFSHFQKKYLFH